MKLCPKCGGAAEDDDVFCQDDGARLEGSVASAATSPSPSSAASPAEACAVCGAAWADEDGYCGSCGHKQSKASVTPRVGTVTAAGEVLAVLGGEQFVVRSPRGDHVAVFAFGDDDALEREHEATRALAAASPAFPIVLGRGVDENFGAFVLFERGPTSARRWAETAPTLAVESMLEALGELVALTRAVAQTGAVWQPAIEDVWVTVEGRVVLSRVRVHVAAGAGGGAAHALPYSLFRPLLPEPAVRAGPRLVRALAEGSRAPASLEALRLELAACRDWPGEEPGGDASPCAAESDVGLKHAHNEDAFALREGETRGERWTVMVVCDGVSSSARAEQASAIAAKTAGDVLAHFAASGEMAFEAASSAMNAAIRAAHLAVCASFVGAPDGDTPGTTIVASLLVRSRLTVGWVGDSRAYWLAAKGAEGAELLTHDHSWINETVGKGEMTEEEALRSPLAHALTRCLGPLETGSDKPREVDVSVRTRDLPTSGYVLLCSDGLWNYFPRARDLSALVQSTGLGASPPSIARLLVGHALARGGHDNVTATVLFHRGDARPTRHDG